MWEKTLTYCTELGWRTGEEQTRAGEVDQMTKWEEWFLFSLGLSYYFARIVHDSSHGGSSVVMMTEEVIFFFHV